MTSNLLVVAAVAAVVGGTALAESLESATYFEEEDSYAFLVRHMPEKDRAVVGEDFLRETVALAEEARRTAPWRAEITDELFREYILPYSSIGEDPDAWRPEFRKRFWPLVKDCRTIGEAAAILNAKVFEILDVRYDTRRDKADQSPFHSMRLHMASCTGLTILQVDAFRACGIPARLAGCNWTPIPGNHSWLEYYENGAWHFFGDPEGDAPAPVDRSWFTAYAACADASEPRTRIYATRWSPKADGTRFWLTWRGEDRPSDVPADDVTASYRRFRAALSDIRVGFVARDAEGRRTPRRFRLVESGSKKVVFEGETHDERHDMNDHLVVTRPEGAKLVVQTPCADGAWKSVGLVEFKTGDQQLFTFGADEK